MKTLLIRTSHPFYGVLGQLFQWNLLPKWIGLEWDDVDDDFNIPF